MALQSRAGVVIALGTAQTLAWASSYYLLAVLAVPMARDVGTSVPTVFGAFSAALLVSAFAGPHSGRAIDRWGGRPVLMGSNLAFALGLSGLGLAQGTIGLFVAWALIGVGMASGLYEAAFAALVRLYGRDSRNVITGIALLGGLASTLGWPLSAWLETRVGWRGACFAWAALHIAIALPLNWALPRPHADPVAANETQSTDPAATTEPAHGTARTSILLAIFYALTWFISTAMAAHLPRLLVFSGATVGAAVAVGALIGPAQVAGRLLELGLLRKVHPLMSARLGAALQPMGALALAIVGAPAGIAFALLHGAGNGILTIAKGTLPLFLFGAQGYGLRQGLLTVPARIAQASAPWVFGLCLDRWHADALWLSAGLGIASFAILLLLRSEKHPAVSSPAGEGPAQRAASRT
jgi:predicted MFS family arabinose efflux permease